MQFAWIAVAFAALAVGALLYAIARPHAAMFLPPAWHHPVFASTGLPLATALIGAAPTFLHAVAMSLLIVVAAQAATPRGRGWCCAAVCAVEIAFEVAQYPAVGVALLGSASSSPAASGIELAFRSYLTRGTFDPLDVFAACVGCLLAFAALGRSAQKPRISFGGRHVAA